MLAANTAFRSSVYEKHKCSLLILLLLLSLVQSCTDQGQTIKPILSNMEVVLLEENDHLQHLVRKLNQGSSINGRTNSLLDEVNFERAIKKHSTERGNTHYSFAMQSDNGLTIRKFILSENNEHKISRHIFEYEVDAVWLSENAEFPGWDQYNGFFRILDLEEIVIAENKIIAGASINAEHKSGRSSGTSCITYTQLIGYICVGGSCSPKYETITTCFSSGGGSGGNETSQENPESIGVEMGPTDMPIDGNGGGGNSSACGDGYIKDVNGNCIQGCPSGQETVNGNCEPVCPSGQRRDQNGHCTIIEDCDTADQIINAIQDFLQEIWANTKVTSDQTLMSDRMEDGGWVTESDGNYSYTPFPSDWERTPCGINPPADWQSDIPSNAVGWVHAHPFFLGEDRRSICGYDKSEAAYQGGPSVPDWETLIAVSNQIGNFGMKAYTIDGDLVSSVDILQNVIKYNRCGY
jgi:hypothetical protein